MAIDIRNSKTELAQLKYHWFWGLRVTKGVQPNNLKQLAEQFLTSIDKINAIREKQAALGSRSIILRFFFRIFNIRNYARDLYLLPAVDRLVSEKAAEAAKTKLAESIASANNSAKPIASAQLSVDSAPVAATGQQLTKETTERDATINSQLTSIFASLDMEKKLREALAATVEGLKMEIQANAEQLKNIFDLQAKVSQLSDRVDTLNYQTHGIQTLQVTIDELRKEIKATEQQSTKGVTENQTKISQLIDNVAVLDQKGQEIDALAATIEQLKVDLKANVEPLTSKISGHDETISQLTNNVADLKKETQDREQTLTADNERLTLAVNTAASEISRLKESITAQEKIITRLKPPEATQTQLSKKNESRGTPTNPSASNADETEVSKALRIFGFNQLPNEQELLKRYKELALKIHPDKNPNDPTAGTQFAQLGVALEYLSARINNGSASNEARRLHDEAVRQLAEAERKLQEAVEQHQKALEQNINLQKQFLGKRAIDANRSCSKTSPPSSSSLFRQPTQSPPRSPKSTAAFALEAEKKMDDTEELLRHLEPQTTDKR